MAYPSPCKLLLAVLFAATAASVAHGNLVIGGKDVAELIVAGRLVCTVPGNSCSNCPGIAGVNLFLSCNGGQTNLAQALTNPAGTFNLTLSTADGALFDQSKCFVYTRLPIASCAVFPPTGTLRAVVSFVSFVQSTVGQVANFVTGIFALA